jgi:hypothetical protein
MVSKTRRETRIRSRLPLIGSLRLEQAPKSRAEVVGMLKLSLTPLLEGTCEHT